VHNAEATTEERLQTENCANKVIIHFVTGNLEEREKVVDGEKMQLIAE
jgi:hypothetical protein